MPNPAERLRYIKWYISSSPRPIKNPITYIRYICQYISSWSRRPDTILKNNQNATFVEVINKPITYKFFKDFTNLGTKSNWATEQ